MTAEAEAVPFLHGNGAPVASPLASGQVTLAWEDVSFTIDTGKDVKKTIFSGVNGKVQAGRLTAVMGPSGSGKTSLLNILAGRMTGGGKKTVAGEISFKGKHVDPVEFRRRIAYVMQEDALFPTQTAFEALEFSAAMRLPQDTPVNVRNDLCEEMLSTLGLTQQRDTYAGSTTVAGLSGGQKKRLACGVELITNPDILFLDEPTSGLDSYAAMRLCKVLRRVAGGYSASVGDDDHGADAHTGPEPPRPRSVVCTIHQPSSEVFELFDDVILLGDGGLVYAGPRERMASCKGGDFFTAVGHPCPQQYNPADFVMFCLQSPGCRATPDAWERFSKEQDGDSKGLGPRRVSSRLIDAQGDVIEPVRAGICRQMQYLGIREFRNVIRDKRQLIARFGTTIFINVLVGIVFKGVGGKWDTPSDVRDHFGALSQVAIGGMFGISQPVLLSFPMERPIFLREYASGAYRVAPYVISKLLVDVPLSVLQAVVMTLVTYWLLDLQGVFPWIALAIALIGLAGSGLALVIGSVASEATVAIQLSPVLFVPQFLFAGFFVATTKIPSWIRWAQYLCTLKYGLNLMAIAEFNPGTHVVEEDINGTLISIDLVHGDEGLFSQMDINVDQKWMYVGIMLGFFLGLRIVAAIILTRRARSPVQ
eukprot:Hpha_TRINITY_DN15501_c3_g1::TRINITY_DN15501_c3_g1_i1::g.105526::m.105526/K05679/ABCG1; ATP-binding cassette, subfamily G (WHITE), member 1